MTLTGTLQLYIARRFLTAILGAFLLCLVLIFLIDFIEMLRESSKQEAGLAAIAGITLLRLPSFAELTIPFAVLIGAIATLLMMSRSSELVILRAAGISAWQFVAPGLAVAMLVGLVAIGVYNPLAAAARAASERAQASMTAADGPAKASKAGGTWLRQDGPDGPSVLRAAATADGGTTLAGVSLLQFDSSQRFVARIEAAEARLRDGYWLLTKANISAPGEALRYADEYRAKTFLDASQVTANIGNVDTVSFWELPGFIDYAERAGLDATRYRLHYQMMLARPLLYLVMVLVAATCALKSFRFGKIQTMVMQGLAGGFAIFVLAEVSRKLGQSEVVSAVVAAWGPIAIAGFLALTVLLFQEDG